MNRTIKSTFLAATLMAVCAPWSHAQWATDLSQSMLISETDAPGQDYPLCELGPDGKFWVAWVSWDKTNTGNVNGHPKMQLLDSDGTPLLDRGGIYISEAPTSTWMSGYDLKTTASGDALLAFIDKRDGALHPFVYRVAPDGTMPWGVDGVGLLAETSTEAVFNTKICVTPKGNIYVGFWSLDGAKKTTKIFKLSADGKMAWGGNLSLPTTTGNYSITPNGDDGFMLSYYTDDNCYGVMKYTSAGEAAWDTPKLLDASGSVSVTAEAVVAPDGKGGFFTCWRNNVTQFSNSSRVQHVNADGTMAWSEPYAIENLGEILPDGKGGCYAAWRSGATDDMTMILAHISDKGTMMWEDEALPSRTGLVAVYGIAHKPDGSVMAIYRNAYASKSASIDYCIYTNDGVAVASGEYVSTMAGDKGHGDIATSSTGTLVVWGDNDLATATGGRVYGHKIAFATAGIDTIEASHPAADQAYTIFDMAGIKVGQGSGLIVTDHLPAGIYIVETAGTHHKIKITN